MKSFYIENREMPALMLGCSPFCGSRQFKEKAMEYYKKFYEQPANITDMLVKFCSTGYYGAHLLPSPPFVSALVEAYEKLGRTFPVIFTFMPDNPEQQWQLIEAVDTVGVFLHGADTDTLDFDRFRKFTEECRKRGYSPGFATHNGGEVIPALDREKIDAAAYLCPFNKTGAHVYPSLDTTLEAIKNTDKTVIGMKILSCGELSPEEAFPFALPHVDAAAVGMVTFGEIEENCRLFAKYENLLASKRK